VNCNFFSFVGFHLQEDTSISCISNSVSAYKYFFSNRISNIWNVSPNIVFEASSSNNFRRLLDQVDLFQFTVLL